LIKDIFDSLPKVSADDVNSVTFFISCRKNKQIRAINTAVARDPEGICRLPRETFTQVFDRMEYENSSKTIDWATIVEYFTKRGRPLTKEEIKKLVDEDKREREEEADRLRANEEAERRRMARLMDKIEDEEDYEAYKFRTKNEQGGGSSGDEQDDRDSQDRSGSFSSDGSRLSGEGTHDYDDEDDFDREKRRGKRRNRRSGRPSGLLKTSSSAHHLDKGGNLRKSRLSKDDYADRKRSSMSRGKY